MTQAVSCRRLSPKSRVQSQVTPFGIVYGPSDTETRFSLRTSVFPHSLSMSRAQPFISQ
jgi:hypothetical protein